MCKSGGQMKFHPILQHHYQVQGMVENELHYYHSWKGFAYLLHIQGGEIMWWLHQELQTKDMYGSAKKIWMASFLLGFKHNKKNQRCQGKSHFQGWHLMWHPCVDLLSHLFHFSYLMYCVLNVTFLLNLDHVSFILCIYVLFDINMFFYYYWRHILKLHSF